LFLIPTLGIFEKKDMAKNTSILLGDYFDSFINNQVKSGKYTSASEVIRAALRMFEQEENKKAELVKALIKGEKSGFVENFDRDSFLDFLKKKHSKNEL
jgi:antitoxin ParD1/3/4